MFAQIFHEKFEMCKKDFGRGIYMCTKFLPATVFKISSDIKFGRVKFVATNIFTSGNFNLFTMVLVVPILHKLHAIFFCNCNGVQTGSLLRFFKKGLKCVKKILVLAYIFVNV